MVAVEKFVYTFEEADPYNKKLFGGKGSSLILMSKLGFDVPPGFIIPTTVCKIYFENGRKLPEKLKEDIRKGIKYIEDKTVKKVW